MNPVYIYARWSSLEQSKGSTLARQIENCRAFLDEQGWSLAADPIIDKGRSAYTGENILQGNLGVFARQIEVGAIVKPILVVEELDRLSRQPADVMLTWLSPLVRAGMTVLVTKTNQKIDQEMLDHNIGGLMTLLVVAFGSYTESRKKSDRVGAAWEKKRLDARSGERVTLTHRHPKWLRVEAGEFQVDPIRGAVVRTIFDLRCNGLGKGAIAQHLNRLAIEDDVYAPWGVDHWTPTYVGRVIRNRAVIGEWQPHRWPRKDARRTKAGDVVESYYPAVIDDATFAQANEHRTKEALKHQGRGIGLSNLIGTVARCKRCGGQMVARGSARYRINADGSRTRHYYLYCQNAKIAKTCSNGRGWAYDHVEKPLLDKLLALAMDDRQFVNQDANLLVLETTVYSARASVDKALQRKNAILALLDDEGDLEAKAEYTRRHSELMAAREKLETAERVFAEARGEVSPGEHLRRVADVRDTLDHAVPEQAFQARMLVKTALNSVIDRMLFDDETGRVSVYAIGEVEFFWIEPEGVASHSFDLSKPRWLSELVSEQREVAVAIQRRKGAKTGAQSA